MNLAHLGLHLGPVHPVETFLTLLLAFGPLVLLVATVMVTRRRSRADREDTTAAGRLGSSHEPDRADHPTPDR